MGTSPGLLSVIPNPSCSFFRDAKSIGDSLWTSNESSGMAIVLGFNCRLELLEPEVCLELEEAIDELEGLGGSRFSV